MDYEEDNQKKIPVELDMDKAKRQLAELADEFGVLLAQSIRMAVKDAAKNAEDAGQPNQPAHSMTSNENIDRIMSTVGSQASMATVERSLDDIKGLLTGIQGLLGRPSGSLLE